MGVMMEKMKRVNPFWNFLAVTKFEDYKFWSVFCGLIL